MSSNNALEIGGVCIEAGESKQININVARLYDFTEMTIPVEVTRGIEDGPQLFVCAAIHGDEINGVEIIKRLLQHRALKKSKGLLLRFRSSMCLGITLSHVICRIEEISIVIFQARKKAHLPDN